MKKRCFSAYLNAALALVLLLSGVVLVSAASVTQAQDAAEETGEPDDRAIGFRAVSGPQVEQVPGGKLLVGAYGLGWAAVLLFMWLRIERQQKHASGELARLSRAVEAAEKRQ